MSIQFEIRQKIPSDIPYLKRIVNSSFPLFFRFFATHSLSEEWDLLVAENLGTVVGFAKLIEFYVDRGKFGCVLWLAVDPRFRRKGIAGSLVKAGTDRLKQEGARAIFASVQRRNQASLSVFGLQGFVKVSFFGLWRLFHWRVFEFYRDIWFAPGEVVLMYNKQKN